MEKKEYYLDNAATTRVSKKVAKAVEPYLFEKYGNPSSLHFLGEEVFNEINKVRKYLALELKSKAEEIIFTSGGTESNNLAIQGLARGNPKRKTIVISEIEHPSVMEVAEYFSNEGYKIIKIPVDSQGFVNLNILEKEISKNKNEILVVSIMHVNNIFGTIQDISKIGKICRENNILFHTDAVQSFGKLKIDVSKGFDLLSASAHKINGLKGTGFLYVRNSVKIKPLVFGGGQERGLRNGTENVPGIIGFGKALEEIKKVDFKKIQEIRNLFIEELKKIEGKINGSLENRIHNNIHVSFPGIEGDSLVAFLSEKGIYVSTGSACDSKKEKEDRVLKAIGLSGKEIKSSIRITINEDLKEKNVKKIVLEIKNSLDKLRIS